MADNNIKIIAENGYTENSLLINLNTNPIHGFDTDGSVKTFGSILYKQVDGENLEIVITLQNLPKNLIAKDGKTVPYPNKLVLGYSVLCCENQDLEVKSIPNDQNPITITVEETEDGRNASTSTSVAMNLLDQKVDSFFLYTVGGNKQIINSPYSIQEDPKKDWPARFKQKNFPFLWVYL